MELGGTRDFDGQSAQASFDERTIVCVDIRIAQEDLFKECLAIACNASSGLVRAHLPRKRECQVLFGVPCKILLALLGEGITQSYGIFRSMIEADSGIASVRSYCILFLNANNRHIPTPLC